MDNRVIGITMGDPAGVGPELIVKAEASNALKDVKYVVIGAKEPMLDAIKICQLDLKLNVVYDLLDIVEKDGVINLLDLDNVKLADYSYGEINKKAGGAAVDYIMKSIELSKEKKIDAVVTGPIHKESIQLAGCKYPGHAEIYKNMTGTEDYACMLVQDNLRVIHVTTHVSLAQAIELIKKDRVYRTIKLANKTLKELGISKPRIAVAGLNPHSGEHGLFGDQDIKEIEPAVELARQEGINAEGPIPPDTIFSKAYGGQYDVAIAMYHDQGHIPVKVLGFRYDSNKGKWLTVSGINVTLGLPLIRTSVDHGVAFDIAGQGKANPDSLIAAFKMAVDFIK